MVPHQADNLRSCRKIYTVKARTLVPPSIALITSCPPSLMTLRATYRKRGRCGMFVSTQRSEGWDACPTPEQLLTY